MKQPGRKSTAQLEVVGRAKVVEKIDRPKPPREMNTEQGEVWSPIVDALPPEWFPPETHQSLVSYCRHVVQARRIAELIDAEVEGGDDFDLRRYDKLLAMQERESRAMSSLATRMRLTQQSTYDKEKSKGKGRGMKRPWDNK